MLTNQTSAPVVPSEQTSVDSGNGATGTVCRSQSGKNDRIAETHPQSNQEAVKVDLRPDLTSAPKTNSFQAHETSPSSGLIQTPLPRVPGLVGQLPA